MYLANVGTLLTRDFRIGQSSLKRKGRIRIRVVRLAKNDLAAGGMFDDTGGGDLRADINGGGEDSALPANASEFVRVIDAVLQRENNRPIRDQWRDGISGYFRVIGFDAKKHQINVTHTMRVGDKPSVINLQISVRASDGQAVCLHCREMMAAGDKGDLVTSGRELGTKVPADGTGAHYRDAQGFTPISRTVNVSGLVVNLMIFCADRPGGLSFFGDMLLDQTMEKIDAQRDHLELDRFKPGTRVTFKGKSYFIQRRTTLASGEAAVVLEGDKEQFVIDTKQFFAGLST